ncbi:MAG: chromate transporter [Herbinix sp.]|jgi:chromate transporter|nr:chromate transporter [Herbinix sp.]
MKKDFKFYLRLFASTFYLSAFTFGGGYVIISLMRKKFVDQYQWIEENEMLDLTAIAQSTPGPIAVNASILVGYRMAGVLGALLTVFGTVLPPLIILSVISVAYTAFRDSVFVGYTLKGMQAGVAAVIIDVVINMIHNVTKEKKKFPILLMIAAFVATFVFDVSVIIIILVCGVLGAISIYATKHTAEKEDKT